MKQFGMLFVKEIKASYRDYILFLVLLAGWMLIIIFPSNMSVLARREKDLIEHFSLVLSAAFSGYWLYSLQREAWSGAHYQMLAVPAKRTYFLLAKLCVFVTGLAAATAVISAYLSVTGFLWYPPGNFGVLWRLNNLVDIPFAALCCTVLARGCSYAVARNRFALAVLVFIVSFLAYRTIDMHIPVSGISPVIVQAISFAVTFAYGIVTSAMGILFYERFGEI